MKKIGIIYGSTTGNTQSIAEKIAKKLSSEDVTLIDASKLKTEDLDVYPNLILGTSTWGLGDLQDDWDGALGTLKKSNLAGKTVAFFGLGDSDSYSDTFVDGMGILYETVQEKGGKTVGEVSTEGYHFDSSKAVVGDHFVGVALDEDSQSNLTDGRIDKWIATILPAFQ